MTRRTLIAAALVIAASTGLLMWKPWREPYTLPEFDAAVYIDGRSAKETPVAASDLSKLRAAFAETYHDHSPDKWMLAGFLRLEHQGRTAAEITLGAVSRKAGPFSINGVDYAGYDEDAVREFLPIPKL